jgi:pyrroline-5-carboxylate reductase
MADATFSICLVGAGNMGGAMLAGWLDDGIPASSITVLDPSPPEAMVELMTEAGVNHETVVPGDCSADVVVIAVKPQLMTVVLPGLASIAKRHTVYVSIAAGTGIDTLARHLGDVPIIRAMPNTPAQVRRGITVCVGNNRVKDRHRTRVSELMSSIGAVEWVDDEDLIDAVTAVSGSGPAYVFLLAEALGEAGAKAGLPADLAARLARATVSGAGELMRQSLLEPDQLRKNVTSPGGTTAAALGVLMASNGMYSLLDAAVGAAANRSRALKRDD